MTIAMLMKNTLQSFKETIKGNTLWTFI
jgi:5,10-methylene-tetrahydrofolate dehydrogenase/methenyl tetrahydrofolate cyclohydrolase